MLQIEGSPPCKFTIVHRSNFAKILQIVDLPTCQFMVCVSVIASRTYPVVIIHIITVTIHMTCIPQSFETGMIYNYCPFVSLKVLYPCNVTGHLIIYVVCIWHFLLNLQQYLNGPYIWHSYWLHHSLTL